MYFPSLDFYVFDIQAIAIIIITICLVFAVNKFIIKKAEDDKKEGHKGVNEVALLLGGAAVGGLISLIVSYLTLESDNIDTSDYYN
tara:strand:- start:5374 stop:5631 length:258 start_codon:yes stop_codon:yes gene_type:complete